MSLNINELKQLLGEPLQAPQKSDVNATPFVNATRNENNEILLSPYKLEQNDSELLVEFYDDDGSRLGFDPSNLWYPLSLFDRICIVVGNTGRFYLRGQKEPIKTKGLVLIWKMA